MTKVRLPTLLKTAENDLRNASPKSRDRLRHRVLVLRKALVIARKPRAA